MGRVVHRQFAVVRGRGLKIADPNRNDIRIHARPEFAAAVAAADQHRPGALGHAQGLDRQGRDDPSTQVGEQGRSPDDAVPIADDADEARPRGAVADHRQGGDRALERGQGAQRRGARYGDAGVFGGPHRVGVACEVIACDVGAAAHGLAEQFVVVGEGRDLGIVAPGGGVLAQDLGGARRGGAIGFGEDDVEGDGGGPGLGQGVGQTRHVGARPRPLAEPLDGLVVDVHHPDGRILIGPGPGALIGVEDEIADLDHEGRLRQVQDQQQNRDGQARSGGGDIAGQRHG